MTGGKKIKLEKKGERIPEVVGETGGEVKVVPFQAGEKVWSLEWVDGADEREHAKGIADEVVEAALGRG